MSPTQHQTSIVYCFTLNTRQPIYGCHAQYILSSCLLLTTPNSRPASKAPSLRQLRTSGSDDTNTTTTKIALRNYFIVVLLSAVVTQWYRTSVEEEYVLQGNSAIMKCSIPSFVADFVTVQGWLEETTGDNYPPTNHYGKVVLAMLVAVNAKHESEELRCQR